MTTKKTNKRADRKGMMMSDGMKERYQELFIGALDQMEGANYQMPWVSPHKGAPCNIYRKGKPYQRSNAFWLSMLMQLMGWETPYFITKTDIVNADGNRKYKNLQPLRTLRMGEDGMPVFSEKGEPVFDYEHRFPVIFYKAQYKDAEGNRLTDEQYWELTAEEQAECKKWWVQQSYRVYNIDQTNFRELYPEDYVEMTRVPEHDYEQGVKDEVLEKMIYGEWRCPIKFGGHSAHYSPGEDIIRLPERERFLGDERFYGVAIHEMAHSTAKELGRDVRNAFGTKEYAMEEFVAELTSACVCSMLGIGKLLDENHIAYVANWRKALREDRDFIPQVIDHVQRASNNILRKYDEVNKRMHPLALPMAA